MRVEPARLVTHRMPVEYICYTIRCKHDLAAERLDSICRDDVVRALPRQQYVLRIVAQQSRVTELQMGECIN